MSRKMLKSVRVIVSLTFFLFTLFVFIDLKGILSTEVINAIIYLQFIPSLIQFFGLFSMASAGFLFVLILTLLFGRIYCSSVCPLGTIQDIASGTHNRIRKRSSFHYRRSLPWLKYSILAITFVPLFFGNIFLLTLLDPFSFAGKIFTGLIHVHAWPAMLLAGALFLFIVLLSVSMGRWFCTEFCPVGTLLGLLSRGSLFRIRIDADKCKSCGNCGHVCKAGCIDSIKHNIEFSRCVACFNCLDVCPEKGIKFKRQVSGVRIQEKRDEKISGSRRDFLKTTILSISALAVSKLSLSQEEDSAQEEFNPYPATPPGSISFRNYTEKCTSCHLCVAVCPTKVLQPTLMGFGLTGILQPRMDYEANSCDYECKACTDICPTGAIRPQLLEQKQRIQIGVSKLIKNLCIPVDEGKACGLCEERCPTKAIEMIPYLGDLKIPRIDEKVCVGCGSCEFICPTRPIRAIYVEPHLYHRTAIKSLKKAEPATRIKTPEEGSSF